ncbi:MAG: homospermidine synthase [Rhodospirillaceae bacterium]|nr:homospermidine synthase [Rhodospirillales bacterium]
MNKHASFGGRLVFIGFGSIGQGVLPLILRHFDIAPSRIAIITADERGHDVADEYGIKFLNHPLTRDNFRDVLTPMLGAGDFLLNVSVDVSSLALVELCWERGALYMDTCIEPWAGGYTDMALSPSLRSNYALREQALKLKAAGSNQPTAILTHGANPGLVSHFIKQALLNIARDTGIETTAPTEREGWAALAEQLSIKVIHVAERDTQASPTLKQVGEFVNTWSIDGFVGEGCQPAELGWGSHERHWPNDAMRHDFGSGSAIFLMRPGASTRVRTWTPNEGPFHGFLVTHSEAISTADYYTVKDNGGVRYRPTCHYAYHPCDDAVASVHELAGKNWHMQPKTRLMSAEITAGMDELGVLLAGHKKGAYWFGSQLSIAEARRLAPHNNATSLQVTATVLAGMVWALENPRRGVVEPEELDFQRILEIAIPYLGPLVGAYTDWTPLADRGVLFPEDVDREDPWQFKNVRVV